MKNDRANDPFTYTLTEADLEAGLAYNSQVQRWHREYQHATPQQRWAIIRTIYAAVMPEIMQASATQRRGMVHPYFVNWAFTPIEEMAWYSIRALGLPLYPQVPVERFFLDFANPYYRIGVELDGAAYHNEAKDAQRDQRLIDVGWMMIRITGKEVFAWSKFEENEDEPLEESLAFWNTSHGILTALDRLYFSSEPEEYPYFDEATRALEQTRSGSFLHYWQKQIS